MNDSPPVDNTQPQILVTGGTGLVGRRLLNSLLGPVCVLSRKPPINEEGAVSNAKVRYLRWNAASIIPPVDLGLVRAAIHLAGDPVAEGRWNIEKKQRIRDSRVIGTRCLVKSLAQLPTPPEVLISASAVGYYGNRPGETLTEASTVGQGFLPEVCAEWEAEAEAAQKFGIRVCRIRIGIVLDPNGGALGKMLPIFRMGLGGPLGFGRQHFPWIHAADLVGLIRHCLEHENVTGPINAVAPTPTTNWTMTRALARAVGRPAVIPAPKFGLQLLFGEFGKSLFDDQLVQPRVAIESGYSFQYTTIEAALQDLLPNG
ncbi:MAG: TIGR01777 family oxidoreductase [Planctomycetaceae bacterium]|nr:TIGR01777 family oxidoreductase [Planctomycetaceae bacterium]